MPVVRVQSYILLHLLAQGVSTQAAFHDASVAVRALVGAQHLTAELIQTRTGGLEERMRGLGLVGVSCSFSAINDGNAVASWDLWGSSLLRNVFL